MAVENIVIKYVADTSGLKEAGKGLSDLERKENELKQKIEETNAAARRQADTITDGANKSAAAVDKTGKSFNSLQSMALNMGAAIAGAFAVDKLLQFGAKVISITAEFQKMNAVLKNTLGSQGAADSAMRMIQDFAAKTPFSVAELTDSFVKLANRGFVPTKEQMRQLGDLASSTGKSFDQLAEAALDAMTGEFERLKEFGVRAQSEGDKVLFTFKGVTTEVEKTDTAIQNYVLSLGDIEGVTGSMAAVSETLSGKLSNLGDSFDQLFLAIGSQSSGVMTAAVDDINGLVAAITKAVQVSDILLDDAVPFGTKMAILFSPTGVTDALNIFKGGADAAGEAATTAAKSTDEWAIKTESQIQKLQRLKKETIEQRDALAQGTPQSVFNDLNKEIALYDEKIRKLTTLQGVVPQNGIEPITARAVQLIQDGNTELGELALTMADIEAATAGEDPFELRKLYADALTEFWEYNGEKVRIAQDTADALRGFINGESEAQVMALENRLAALDEAHTREIELAGENTRVKNELERDYADKKKEIEREIAEERRKQAILNKAAAAVEIIINTAQGVSKAIAVSPHTFGLPWSAFVGAMGALQLATVLRQPIPKYATGTRSVTGGIEGQDSVLAMLMPGERVVKTKTNREKYDLFNDIEDGRLTRKGAAMLAEMPGYEHLLAHEARINALAGLRMNFPASVTGGGRNGVDLGAKLDRIEKAIIDKPVPSWRVRGKDIVEMSQSGNKTTTYLNQRHG